MTAHALLRRIPMMGPVGKRRAVTARLTEIKRLLEAFSYDAGTLGLFEKEITIELNRYENGKRKV